MAWLNKVTIVHPTDNSAQDIQLDDEWSAAYVAEELVSKKFLTPLGSDREEYRFVNKENDVEFRGDQTFAQAGVKENGTVNVAIRAKAGGTTRNERLESDYNELRSMAKPDGILSFRILEGTAPRVEAYEITFKINSIVGVGPQYRNEHKVRIDFPAGYPLSDHPKTICLSKPYPFHPNWYATGEWCYGSATRCTEGLGDYVVRLMRVLQFDTGIIDVTSSANSAASTWYTANKNKGYFPCDNQTIPHPRKGIVVLGEIKRG